MGPKFIDQLQAALRKFQTVMKWITHRTDVQSFAFSGTASAVIASKLQRLPRSGKGRPSCFAAREACVATCPQLAKADAAPAVHPLVNPPKLAQAGLRWR
jgi:hypothetical protein